MIVMKNKYMLYYILNFVEEKCLRIVKFVFP